MKKILANSVSGFLLKGIDDNIFFRVYNENDKSQFKDFAISARDIEVKIVDRFVSFCIADKEGEVDHIDYSDKALGKSICENGQDTLQIIFDKD